MTLIRSSQSPDPLPDYGQYGIDIGVGICANDNMELYRMSSAFIHPMQFVANRSHDGTLPLRGNFIEIGGEAAVSAVKTAEREENALIIRIFDATGKGTSGNIKINGSVKSAALTGIMEEDISPVSCAGGVIPYTLRPSETATIKIRFSAV